MQNCLAVLMSDPQAALGAVVHDRVAGGGIHAGYIDYLRVGHRASGKPAFLVANRQGTGADPLIVEATREGFPVLDGLESFLRGVRHLFDHRDFAARNRSDVPVIPETALARMRARLADRRRFDENDALTLLGDAGLPANAGTIVEGEAPAIAAARSHRLPGRAEDGEARPRPQERAAGHPPRRSRTRRPSRPPTATSPSASTRACWSRR